MGTVVFDCLVQDTSGLLCDGMVRFDLGGVVEFEFRGCFPICLGYVSGESFGEVVGFCILGGHVCE